MFACYIKLMKKFVFCLFLLNSHESEQLHTAFYLLYFRRYFGVKGIKNYKPSTQNTLNNSKAMCMR